MDHRAALLRRPWLRSRHQQFSRRRGQIVQHDFAALSQSNYDPPTQPNPHSYSHSEAYHSRPIVEQASPALTSPPSPFPRPHQSSGPLPSPGLKSLYPCRLGALKTGERIVRCLHWVAPAAGVPIAHLPRGMGTNLLGCYSSMLRCFLSLEMSPPKGDPSGVYF